MSELARMFIGVILLAAPFVQYASYFLSKLCCAFGGKCAVMNDSQKAMIRCSRAHTGGLLTLSLFAEYLIDFTNLPLNLDYIIRYTFPIAVLFIAIGYYFTARHKGTARPSRLCGLKCLGSVAIVFSVIVLGIGILNR